MAIFQNIFYISSIQTKDDDKTRQRILEIEQWWNSSSHDKDELKSDGTIEEVDSMPSYAEAFRLSSEQLVLCQKLDLQAGILAYIGLHCIEAASGILVEHKDMKQPEKKKEAESFVKVR